MNKTTLFLAMSSLLLLAACKQEVAAPEEIRPVRTETIAATSAQTSREFAGEVVARHEAALAFRVGGKILERRIDVGSPVKFGQVLAKLDPQDLALNVKAAQAQKESALAQLTQQKLELARAQSLQQKNFVSQAEVDRLQTAALAAELSLKQAQAQADLASNQLEHAELRADAAGVVTQVAAEQGQVVAAGQTIVRIAREGAREIAVDVPEDLRAALQIGQSADIQLWALKGESFKGKIREIAPAADIQTRTFRVRIALDAQHADASLGMSATVRLAAASSANTMTLPMSALNGEGNAQSVWLFDSASSSVKSHPVTVTALSGNRVEVAGLQVGDRVVTAGVHMLREGQKVRLLTAAAQGQ